MSSYRFISTKQLDAVAINGTATVTAAILDIRTMIAGSYQAIWTGTPTGTISITGSDDGINFADFGASISNQPAGSADNSLINLYGVGFGYVKLSYTNASGSGTLTVWASAKTG